jgi:hypothetical protein
VQAASVWWAAWGGVVRSSPTWSHTVGAAYCKSQPGGGETGGLAALLKRERPPPLQTRKPVAATFRQYCSNPCQCWVCGAWQLAATGEDWPATLTGRNPAATFPATIAAARRPTKLHLDSKPYTVQPGWGAAADAQPQLGARQHTQLHPPPRRLCGAAHFLDFGKPFLTRALR